MTPFIFLCLCAGTILALVLLMSLAWRIERGTQNAGWIDVFWTGSLGIVSAVGSFAAWVVGGQTRALLVAALILAWSARLGLHLVARTLEKPDDARYARMRAEMGDAVDSGMFRLCMIQAGVSVPLALSVMLAAWMPDMNLRLQDVLAMIILAIAVTGEGIADAQLRTFAANPANRGKICDVGLWRYTRHPNYFFEWMMWLAWPVFAIDLSGNYPWGWLALFAPACMYWLLNHVSGVPPLETLMVEKYGAAYVDYQRRTSSFLPMFPR